MKVAMSFYPQFGKMVTADQVQKSTSTMMVLWGLSGSCEAVNIQIQHEQGLYRDVVQTS